MRVFFIKKSHLLTIIYSFRSKVNCSHKMYLKCFVRKKYQIEGSLSKVIKSQSLQKGLINYNLLLWIP
jgi:hypothetical protein